MATRRQKPAPGLNSAPSVTPEVGIQLLQTLIDKARKLPGARNIQDSDIEAWRSLTRDYLVRIFGSESPNVNAVLHASGDGGFYMGAGEHEYRQHLNAGLANKIKLLNDCIEQLQTAIQLQPGQSQPPADATLQSNRQSAARRRAQRMSNVWPYTNIAQTKENEVSANPNERPPLPPFTSETAARKVRLAEDGWNTRDPERVSLAYTVDSTWRNRAEFLSGRATIVQFLQRKWAKELDYRLIKELWAFHEARIAVRFAYEWHDDSGNWFRSYGNENWEFDGHGLMRRRVASINDLPITEAERKYRWPLGRRPDDHPNLSDLGL